MAPSSSYRYPSRPPTPPPSDPEEPARGVANFFARQSTTSSSGSHASHSNKTKGMTGHCTPPTSVPTSPSDSPRKYKLKRSGSSSKRARVDTEPTTAGGSSKLVQTEDAPAVARPRDASGIRLAFPTILSDDDDWSKPWDGTPPPAPRDNNGERSSARQAGTGSSSNGNLRRTWSQTTTTRKTEHHSYRYSMSSFDQLFAADDSTRKPSDIPSSASSSFKQSSNSTSSASPSTPRYAFPSSKSFSGGVPLGPRSPSLSSSSSRRSPTPTSTRSTRSSMPSRRPPSFHSSERPRVQSIFGTSPRPSSPFPSRKASRNGRTPSSSSSQASNEFFGPVVNLFAFLVISTVACFSISAVLVASFSLTFYDDCGRRFEDIQRSIGAGRKRFRGSIEGVKIGVERVVGGARGARGALELAAWATTSSKRVAAPTMVLSEPEDDAAPETTSDEEGETDDGGEEAEETLGDLPRSRSTTRRSSSRSRSRRRKPSSTSASSRRVRPTPPPFQGSSPTYNTGGWTDDELPPFDVPPTTPFHSRPASPHRRPTPPRRRPSLPPRPPLAILIPSIFFTLLWTFIKVFRNLWSARQARKKATNDDSTTSFAASHHA